MQQKFDGSFEISETLAKLLQTSVATLRSGATAAAGKMGSLDSDTVNKILATIYLIAMLNRFWSAYDSSWELTADKAKQWCVGALTKSLGNRNTARLLVDEFIASVLSREWPIL